MLEKSKFKKQIINTKKMGMVLPDPQPIFTI